MKNLLVAILFIACFNFSETLYAGCRRCRPVPRSGRVSRGNDDVSAEVERMIEDAKNLTERLAQAEPGSKSEMNLRHRRQILALQIVHEAQRYFLDMKNPRQDGRTRMMRMLLQNESVYLQESLGEDSTFPYLEQLENFQQLIRDIRAGKIDFPDRIPRSDSALLRDIQELQTKALEDLHRQEKRDR